jgi:hypothetical protein
MLLRFGIEPRSVLRLSVRQFNAICAQAARESMGTRESLLMDELHDAAGACRLKKI